MPLYLILVTGMLVGSIATPLFASRKRVDLVVGMLWGCIGALLVACAGRLAGYYGEISPLHFLSSGAGAAMMLPIAAFSRG